MQFQQVVYKCYNKITNTFQYIMRELLLRLFKIRNVCVHEKYICKPYFLYVDLFYVYVKQLLFLCELKNIYVEGVIYM